MCLRGSSGGRAIDCGSGSSRPAAWRIMRARAAAAIDSASRPVFGSSRAVVFLAPVLELVSVVRASRSFEYFHQPAARRVFEVTNWRMVSGRIMTRVPTFTQSILRA